MGNAYGKKQRGLLTPMQTPATMGYDMRALDGDSNESTIPVHGKRNVTTQLYLD